MGRFLTRGALLLAAYVGLASCAVNPASGQRELSFMSPADEKAIGAEQHPQLLREFGGPYQDPEVAGYVAMVGGRMAANSELPGDSFTFTLLNSKIINAFALPGGYVYISRGLLALVNDEAELASVLGHEVGHVTARHAARRQTRATLGGILGAGVGIATGSSELGQLFSQGTQMYLLSYSRENELEADKLGVRYMTRAGYDAYGSARMLGALGAESALEAKRLGQDEAARAPAWARTHPLTEDRVAKALENARAAGGAGNERRRDAFLAAIDGMVYDDDPEQGVVIDHRFLHPKLGFTFSVPDGFALQNSEQSVLADGPGDAAILFAGGAAPAGMSMRQYAQGIWDKIAGGKGGALGGLADIDVNGMKAATASVRIDQQNGALDLRIVAIRYSDKSAYHFLMLSPVAETAALADAYRRVTYSFRRLSAAEAAGVGTRRIRIVTVKPGDNVERLAARMAYDDYRVERFRVLNGLAPDAKLAPGSKVKLVE